MKKRKGASTAENIGDIAKTIIFIAVVVLASYILIYRSFSFGRGIFYTEGAESAPGRDVEVTIYDNDDAGSVAEMLEDSGIIDNALAFRVQATLYKTDLYPGSYTVNTSMSVKEILEEIDTQAEAIRESEAAGSDDLGLADEIGEWDEGDEDYTDEPADTESMDTMGTGDEGA